MKAIVTIMLKDGVLDPQGKAIGHALRVKHAVFEHDGHNSLHHVFNPYSNGRLLHGVRALQVARASLGQNAQAARNFLIRLFDFA